MEKERTRLFLLMAIALVSLFLFNAWEEDKRIELELKDASEKYTQEEVSLKAQKEGNEELAPKEYISVNTDVYKDIKINLYGGDIENLSLKKYMSSVDKSKPQQILDNKISSLYMLQTDVSGEEDKKRYKYYSQKRDYNLGGEKYLQVALFAEDEDLRIQKTFTFNKNKYDIDVSYLISNKTSKPWKGQIFGRIKQKEADKEGAFISRVGLYEGGAVYTENKPYKKLSYSDIKSQGFYQEIKGGWIAMVDRYFITAWIPDNKAQQINFAYSKQDRKKEDVYSLVSLQKVTLSPNATQTIKSKIYIGPEVIENLEAISEGLVYTIDYGVIWPIASVIFWMLKKYYAYFHNWGWAIIAVTITIKLLFYGFMSSSYRTMAKVKEIKPKIDKIKKLYKGDRDKESREIFNLYRKEKVNPITSFIPMIIQIPVFISMYYVFLESVELRHSPFILWITDLTAKDPYFVFPIIMGLSMYIQQQLTPKPEDPVVAKVFSFMPLVLSVIATNMPSGLTLYWALNSVLSNLQQASISKTLEIENRRAKAKTLSGG